VAAFQHPEDYTGAVGCLGIVVGLPAILFMHQLGSPVARMLLAFFLMLIVFSFWLSGKRPSKDVSDTPHARTLPYRNEQEIRAKLRPGVRFKAHGSAGTPMEGTCYGFIDDDTIDAYVGYADQAGGRERGPFPISHIDSVGE